MFEIWSWWCKYLSSFYFVNITFLVSHIFDLGRDKRDAWEQIDYDCEFSVWIRLILTWCRCSIAGLAVSNSPSMCQKQSHERAKRQGILLSIPLKFSWWHVTPETRFGLLARRQFREYIPNLQIESWVTVEIRDYYFLLRISWLFCECEWYPQKSLEIPRENWKSLTFPFSSLVHL